MVIEGITINSNIINDYDCDFYIISLIIVYKYLFLERINDSEISILREILKTKVEKN